MKMRHPVTSAAWHSSCLLAAFMSACDEDDPEIIIPVSPTGVATSSGSATPAATSTLVATSTPAATSTSCHTDARCDEHVGTGGAGGVCDLMRRRVPVGAARAAGPFVCIQSPTGGLTLGSTVELSGYAGGSFENSVVIEIRDENDVTLAQRPLTYSAPEIGTPGSWQVTLPVPPGQPADSAGRIVAYFESPRDGGIVALDSIEVRFP